MNSRQPSAANTPDPANSGDSLLTPDAGPDTSRATYSDEQTDLNDSSSDLDNVDLPIPDTSREDARDNVVDRQMGVISRLPG